MFDRFDIVEAHFWFCADFHGGQGSRLYARLSKISRYFKPGASQNGPSTENARDIYEALAEQYKKDARAYPDMKGA